MKQLIAVCVLGLVSIGAKSQTDFSGTWTLKDKQAIEGPNYANGLGNTVVIRTTKDSLTLDVTTANQDGTNTQSHYGFAANGSKTSYTSASSKRTIERTLQWSADKKSLTLTSVYSVADEPQTKDFTRIDILSLGEDGKTLNFKRRSEETKAQTWEMAGTYTKQ